MAHVDLAGCSALVTGGAGMLGGATARRLVELGAHVVVVDTAESDLAPPPSPSTTYLRADVTSEAEMAGAVGVAADLGALRVVVNCAGTGFVRRLVDRDGGGHDLDSLRWLLEVHVVGYFNVMVQAARAMSRNDPGPDGERGVIVNTASLAGLEGSAGQTAYGAAKAAVAGLTLPAARDLGVLGIRVVSIAPAGVAADDADPSPPNQQRLLDQAAFPRRFGRPEEFVDTVEFIIGNPYVNGSIIRLDGGTRLPAK